MDDYDNPSMPKRLTEEEFRRFADLIYQESGITMKDSKLILLSNRLRKRLHELKLETYTEYFDYLKQHINEELHSMLDVVSTNETYFFRNNDHFKALVGDILPEISEAKKNTKRLRIWSAGCSSGEEPYTIAILVKECASLFKEWKFLCFGSNATDDISTTMLERAQVGNYTLRSVKLVEEKLIDKYFMYNKAEIERAKTDALFGQTERLFTIKPEIKELVQYKKLNLQKDKFPQNVDIIFCRNVMIYFDKEVKIQLVKRFYDALQKPGYLFIGHSETLFSLQSEFKYRRSEKASIYTK